MSEIPENVYAQAREIVAENDRHTDDVLMVARAIIAERERCVKIAMIAVADRQDLISVTAKLIAEAIGSGSKP